MEAVYLGLDAGGTKVAAGVVTASGRVCSHLRVSTHDLRTSGSPLANLVRLGRDAMQTAGVREVAGVGLALPGPVAHDPLRMLAAPTIPEWEGVPLARCLSEAFGAPVAGDNDANVCALGESRFGAGRGYEEVVYFTISTGIGGGIVRGGRIDRGAGGTSAEFGHQVILPVGGPLCDCGNTGCLEALASGRGILARAREAVAQHGGVPPEWCVDGELTASAVAEAGRGGEPIAGRVWAETILYLAAGVSNVINIVDPGVVVLGGGVVAGAQELLLEPLRDAVLQRCMPSLGRQTPILPAALGAEVGIVGAAALAMSD
jgi:glucokinase